MLHLARVRFARGEPIARMRNYLPAGLIEPSSQLLDEPVGAPLLTMQRTTYDQAGTIVEYGSHVYRASRYTFDLSLRGDA